MSSKQTIGLITLVSLFFIWGFFTSMNDILIPHFKDQFTLSYFQAMLVQFSFFGAYFTGSVIYFLISISKGDPINRIGYKKGIMIGLALSALGSALFYPASVTNSYWFFLIALFIVGLGFTMLQISANPYVAILGKPEGASARLNFAQGFNSLGTTIGPALGGYLIFHYFQGPRAVQYPYLVFALVFLLLLLIVWAIDLPRYVAEEQVVKDAGALRYPYLVLGVVAIFMYVGSEVSVGSMMINFLGLKDVAGLSHAEAATFVSIYWGSLMIGRFMGSVSLSQHLGLWKKWLLMLLIATAGFIFFGLVKDFYMLRYYAIILVINFLGFIIGRSMPHTTLGLFALVNVLLLMIGALCKGQVAMWAVIGIGLFNSIMWSNIFTLAIDGLGRYTAQGSSLLVMAIVGGAIIPVIMGHVADLVGVQLSYLVPVLPYLYLAFYGFWGYRIGKNTRT